LRRDIDSALEAFAEAKRLGQPVLVSIGNAACHWLWLAARSAVFARSCPPGVREFEADLAQQRKKGAGSKVRV